MASSAYDLFNSLLPLFVTETLRSDVTGGVQRSSVQGLPSYFNVRVSNGGLLTSDVFYDGWCLDTDRSIGLNTYSNVSVYSTYGTVPPGVLSGNLSGGNTQPVNPPDPDPYLDSLQEVNWIFNNILTSPVIKDPVATTRYYRYTDPLTNTTYLFTQGDIQQAIWELTGSNPSTPSSILGPSTTVTVNGSTVNSYSFIADLARDRGSNFLAQAGDYIGIIFDPGNNRQPAIIQVRTAGIGDTVFFDSNDNGIADIGEGLTGVTVKLLVDKGDGNGFQVVGTTITGDNPDTPEVEAGYYFFGPLLAGPEGGSGITYQVMVDTTTLPGGGVGWVNTVDPDGGNDNMSSEVLTPGEVNLLQDFGYRALDFGDAPDSYGTTLATDGARHVLSIGQTAATPALYLGQRVDTETNGLPSPGADGDNNNNVNDEDGIQFLTPIQPGLTASVSVTVVEATGVNGLLNAWIDFNRDGLFQASEKIFNNVAVANGTQTLNFTTPATALAGETYARFRLSTQSGLTPTGLAPNGEVEDYKVTIGGQQPASLGNFVWDDLNANGVQDANEPGLNGVTVRLLDASGNLLASTTTGDDPSTPAVEQGFYRFNNLSPGVQYQVEFVRPTGFVSFTRPDAIPPGTDATDSDANPANGRSPLITLAPGEYNDTIDAGLLRPVTIGDFVFRDANGNGVQDPGEAGVPNVTVTLTGTDALGNPVTRTTTTDANGQYLFNGNTLLPGSYKVTFSKPPGLAFTVPDQGGDDARDSDADPTNGMTPFVTVGSGGINLTLDAGLVGTAVDIIKFVNGQDANTPSGPVLVVGSNATFTYEVRNTGNISLASVSVLDDNGTPGNPADDFSPTFTGGDTNNNNLLDLNEVWTYSATRTVVAGQYTNQATVTGTPVYPPGTNNPSFPPGTPVPGLTPPTDTDPANYFGEQRDFGDLPSTLYSSVLGAYHVFANQSLRIGTTNTDAEPAAQPNATATGDDIAGSTPDDETGVTIPLITAGQNATFNVNVTNTIGSAATLYGFVDWNRDGDFLDPNEAVTASVANGFSGNVALSFAVPTTAITGQDLGARFRISTATNLTAANIAPNGEVEDYLVRVGQQPASLGNFVWDDLNANGVQDANEPGLNGVTVRLLDASGNLLASTTTGDDPSTPAVEQGFYRFNNLSPGVQYQVEFVRPTGFVSFTRPDAIPPGTDATDSDANPANGRSPLITLAPGEYNDTIDAGLLRPVTIGDFVFRDANGNGVQDPGEAGVPNVTVTLTGTDALGNPVTRTTTTDANGQYLFNGNTLLPGSYKVTFSKPPGLAFTVPDQGGDDARDSDADPTNGMTPFVTVGSGGINLTLDAGLVGTAVDIIKFVNGQDANTPSGPVLVVGSNATFTYEVRNTGNISLASVSVLDDNGTPGNPADDFSPTFTGGDTNNNNLLDLNEVWTYSATRTVVAGQYTNQATVTGTPVYPPGTNNPSFPPGTPVPGLTPPTDTDPANYFGEQRDFGDLPSTLYSSVLGAYHVFANQSLRIGTTNTDAEPAAQPNATATGDDIAGSTPDDETGVTIPLITAGQNATFNVNVTNTIGSAATLYGFVDWNRDGDFLDPNEAVTASVANGFSGNVALSFAVPTTAITGQDLGARFRISTATNLTAANIAPNGEVEDYLVRVGQQPASLGNFVWDDLNANGVQDANEPGLNGVTVRLLDASGNLLASTTTGDDPSTPAVEQGFYRFNNLSPGVQYQVEFVRPTGFVSFTRPDAIPPGTDATDSDANPANGRSPLITLAPGEYNDTIDAGLLRPVTIGDFVFRDANGNGVQDPGEAGVPNVTVTLTGTDALGNPVTRTTTTDANGQYLFNGNTLLPGSYKVTFSKPPGLAFTVPDQGGDDARDSDADPTNGMTPFVTVGSGGINLTLDAGLVGTAVDIIKFVNGQDANTPSGPVLVVGSNATFTYEVRNTGNISLASVSVLDDNGTPGNPADDFSPTFTGGDTNNNNLLDLNEVWTYSATRTVVAGQYTNQATVTGTPVYPPGTNNPSFPPGTPVPGLTPPTDTDPANYFGEQRDFGDLPSTLYSSVLGAYHVFANQSLRIGTTNTDAEPAAQPNATATGDDIAGSTPDDETGVTIPLITAGQNATFNVNVTNTIGSAATLYGFVDWNRDGDFLDPNEAVTASVANGFSGNVALSFAVPTTAITGQDLGARFRISTATNLTAANIAPNGEVEDYLVQVAPQQVTPQLTKTARADQDDCPTGPIGTGNDSNPGTAGVQAAAGIDLGRLTDFLFYFGNGSTDANWQGATKGFAGDVAVNGLVAKERTSGGVPFAGTIYTNDSSLGAWQGIVNQNPGQASGVTGQTALINGLQSDLVGAFQQINGLAATPTTSIGGKSYTFSSIKSTDLNGLNTQDGVNQTFVINVTSGFGVSSQINITGDAGDVYVLRWDSDVNFSNGYQGQVKFQSGGAIVPLGGLSSGNFIHVAGDINASGGGSTPAALPQGPRLDDGTGSLINGGKDFSGGGFFTGYWLTTGSPETLDPTTGLYTGRTASLSNAIFNGGWYSLTNKFSMTSGTSGVHVCPTLETVQVDDNFNPNNVGSDPITGKVGDLITYTYKVSNPTAAPIAGVQVKDDNATPGNTSDDYFATPVLLENGKNYGDSNANGLLDPGEHWYFQSKTLADSPGNFTNTATLLGNYNGPSVTDTALVHIT